ncbi:MAG: hypothetical protein WD688_06925 [Candidatus Binatia bacterium]
MKTIFIASLIVLLKIVLWPSPVIAGASGSQHGERPTITHSGRVSGSVFFQASIAGR